MTIEIRKLSPHIGAEVLGAKIGPDLSDDDFAVIKQAYLDHLVLVFRDQDISPAAQIAYTERFGAVEPHPLRARAGHPEYENLLVLENNAQRRGARNDFWHSDITCVERPPSATFLHALTVPEGRGDTLICNMYRAWDDLDAKLKAKLDNASAEHSGEAIRQRNLAAQTDGNRDMDVPPAEVHPVVRRHPETGRRALFVNKFFTTRILGLSDDENAAVMDAVEASATRDDNIYRHKWRSGDALMWDNRCTMHFAEYDYEPDDHRLMHRTTAAGDRPAA
jgi:taurine dioxygenase